MGQVDTSVGLKVDPRFVQWIGAACAAKVTASDELFVPSEKVVLPNLKTYHEHFGEVKDNLKDECDAADLEKECLKRMRRDRCFDGGLKFVRERATFLI